MISIGCDHGGFELKNVLLKYLTELGFEYKDCGTFTEESVDYPDIAKLVCEDVASCKSEFGIFASAMEGMVISVELLASLRAVACVDNNRFDVI